TWGSAASGSDPDGAETVAQWREKRRLLDGAAAVAGAQVGAALPRIGLRTGGPGGRGGGGGAGGRGRVVSDAPGRARRAVPRLAGWGAEPARVRAGRATQRALDRAVPGIPPRRTRPHGQPSATGVGAPRAAAGDRGAARRAAQGRGRGRRHVGRDVVRRIAVA